MPLIVLNGPEWFTAIGPEKNGGPKLFCISGHVKRPGVYEASMHTTLRELIYDHAGGMLDDRPLKAIIPGGSSVPLLLPDQLDTPASFDAIQKAGSLLGSAGLIVLDDTVCMVWLAMNLLHFYRHESCGKCTPCREGTRLAVQAARAARERGRAGQGSRPAVRRLQQHRRQDAVRVRRRGGDAGAVDDEAVPRGVRGARARGPLHAARAVARGPSDAGGALMEPRRTTSRDVRSDLVPRGYTWTRFVQLGSSASRSSC